MNSEEQNRVCRAVAGDKDALGDLLEFYGPVIAANLVISPTWQGTLDVADVIQVTYLEAFTHIQSFDPARAEAFPAWLRRMAENNLRDAIRSLEAKKNPSPRLQLDAWRHDSHLALFDVLTSGGQTPSRLVRQDEARQRLDQAFGCLPPDYARTVQLYDLEGLPVADVAQKMGRSIGAIYMLRRRAHDRLRELLGPVSQILESRA
ncbi:MAG TPA: sigma-70 family RNA polymerase sigma factor [Phycisphaerae bacterium]|nr:sigma-70 family RNA polymerase sigma factor [Phycisphaerae bacterium]